MTNRNIIGILSSFSCWGGIYIFLKSFLYVNIRICSLYKWYLQWDSFLEVNVNLFCRRQTCLPPLLLHRIVGWLCEVFRMEQAADKSRYMIWKLLTGNTTLALFGHFEIQQWTWVKGKQASIRKHCPPYVFINIHVWSICIWYTFQHKV